MTGTKVLDPAPGRLPETLETRQPGAAETTTVDPPPPRPRRWPTAVARVLETLLAGGAASIPILVSGARAASAGWQPGADQAIILTRAHDVLTGHGPSVGQYSLAGLNGGLLHSPGPMLYWLLALPARFGDPASTVWTMTAVNAAAVMAAVAVARRQGGRPLMFLAAAAVALMCQSLPAEALHDVWNPSAGLFPLTLLLFLCWAVACGRYRLLPVTAVVASFVAQAHLAYVAPAAGAVLVGVIGLALGRAGARRRAGAIDERRLVLLPWVAAALVLALVCWSLPLADQIGGRPGNLGLVYDTATAPRATMGAQVGWHAIVRAVGYRPWWLHIPSSRWQRKYDVLPGPSTLAEATCLAMLAFLALAVVAGALTRRVAVAAAAALALVVCAALAAVAADTPTTPVQQATLGYTMWWGTVAGMWVWLATLCSAAVLGAAALRASWGRILHWRPRPPRRVADVPGRLARLLTMASAVTAPAALCATAAVGAVVAGQEAPDEHAALYRPIAALSRQVLASVPPHTNVLLLGALDVSGQPIKPALRYALVRHGDRPLAPGSRQRLGDWYDLDHRSYKFVVFAGFRPTPPRWLPAHAVREVARTGYRDGWGSHTDTVWIALPGRARPAAPRA